MINIYIDPYVLACPASEEGTERIDSFIESLLNWRKFRLQSRSNFLQSAHTSEALIDTENYPAHRRIEEALRILGRKDVQAKDINTLIGEILKSSTVEDYVEKRGFLIESMENFSSDSDEYLRGRPQEFVDCYQWLLSCAGAIQQWEFERSSNEDFQNTNAHLLRHSEMPNLHQSIVQASGTARCLLESGAEIDLAFDSELPVCTRADHVSQCVNCSIEWIEAKEDEDSRYSLLEIFAEQVARETGNKTSLQFRFGLQFLKTVNDLGFGHEEIKATRLLRACSDAICELRMNQVHHLRTGKGGNAPQRSRDVDGAKAWRRDIDYEYHLHYWIVGGVIEFASVVPHNDFSIP